MRDNQDEIGLKESDDFNRFITKNFVFYSKQYAEISSAARTLRPSWEEVRYVADTKFTFYPMLMLAPLCVSDKPDVSALKIQLMAKYLDIFLARRQWNSFPITYDSLRYSIFSTMKKVRGLPPKNLAQKLYDELKDVKVFGAGEKLRLRTKTRNSVRYLLVRLTDAVQVGTGQANQYEDLMRTTGKNRFEIEHIWANQFVKHKHNAEFSNEDDFAEQRNSIGGLLLVPKSFNASYGDLDYATKLPHYDAQNTLARSLNAKCYSRNPGMKKWMGETGLPFKEHPQFLTADMEERDELYLALAEQIWDPQQLLDMAK